ncbi:ABC transporter permease [Helicobacter sp. MIT 14-3879]|uniref:ABC transporter permease n=1 Tax=Helicobacter sp. MIT 14-3879 TaxID=2040649 RepID=UPI000E1F0E62|nr:ABC transporter permease [Helicobacter sp. MIT 14-3879]RDU65540.1 multidrug ABC transporter substrate-binding protein [Helicobacter sp. MIT 14-3879]
MILNAFILAFRQISRNYLRAILTMLGIIIGTGSVIVMITLGNGMSKKVKENISMLGNNLLILMPARGLDTTGQSLRQYFNIQEVELIKDRIFGINAIAPLGSGSSLIQYKQNSRESETLGVSKEYFIVGNWEIDIGREFLDDEYTSGANVCIIGSSVKSSLFGNNEVLGSRIKVGNKEGSIICECIGVLKEKGQGGGNDQDEVVLFPLKSYLRTLGREKQSINNINQILISLKDGIDSKQKTEEIKVLLRETRNIDKSGKLDNFEIRDTKQFEETLTSTMRMLTLFIGAIAGVSLIVGGIGIMNIMLVSVTERTKEIGTRLAIGALENEVLLQFLIESIVISSLGGTIGIVLAFIISFILSIIMAIPFVFSAIIAFIAFIFSAFLGVLFGYLPAKRASKLNPIDALRHE